MSIGAERFDDFFVAIHGHEPFDWQRRLAASLVDGTIPDVIDVPTGLGKTAVVDAAVFAQATRAAAGLAPDWIRLFFIVDRRLVVDAAFERAELIAARLETATSGVVRDVADALRTLSGPDSPPLVAGRMRGGTTWDWNWVPSPAHPAVVVSTVDQYGSRLLFRGYGLSSRLHPIDAALCGTNALVVIDEAHLSTALLRTIDQASALERSRLEHASAGSGVRAIAMSATVDTPDDGIALRIELDREVGNPVALRRLDASRHVHLVELAGRSPDRASFASVLASAAREMLVDGSEVVGVIVNTVATARAVFEILNSEPPDSELTVDLLIGRTREYEREQVARRLDDLMTSRRQRGIGERRIVVATQTLEVGADLDLDALVTEAAPLDSLLQRLGRIDRDGVLGATRNVLVAEEARRTAGVDPVYQGATWRTWAALSAECEPRVVARSATSRSPIVEPDAGSLDLGFRGQRELASRLAPIELLIPSPAAHPVVLSRDLDTWSQTEPAPIPDQAVAPYLHGLDVGQPTVSVCWRFVPTDAELPPRLPVRAGEQLELPIGELRRFLVEYADGDVADAGTSTMSERNEGAIAGVIAWRVTTDGFQPLRRAADVRPGDNVVIRADRGGLDRWGWAPGSRTVVPDVWDLVGEGVLRLTPQVLADQLQVPVDDPRIQEATTAMAEAGARYGSDDPDVEAPDLDQLLGTVARAAEQFDEPTAENLAHRCAALRAAPRLREQDGVLLVTLDGHVAVSTDDTDDGTSRSSVAMTLTSHLRDVADEASAVAARAGLEPELAEAVRLAALSHDLGKADVRFQTLLRNGDHWAAELAEEPLAKSAPVAAGRGRTRTARSWPRGYRHEDISAALLVELERVDPTWFGNVDRELVVHLAQSHHGWGRPFPRAVLDDEPIPVHVDVPDGPSVTASPTGRVDLQAAERFDRLRRRYGWWGLARLEAIVRLADVARSRRPRWPADLTERLEVSS